jgi:hypothetical protein
LTEELSKEKVIKIFEESWKELVKKYGEARMVSTFCSEADVELNLAHKLLNKLPVETVHIEFPIPFDVERLSSELWAHGRVIGRGCFRPDIVIIDPLEPCPYLFAELKFTPIYWSYLPLYLALEKKLSKEALEELKRGLKRAIDYLQRIRQVEPTQQDIEKTYFGVDKRGRTNVEKLIGILNDFERKEGETVAGYLCVIDEIYPNIKEILKKSVRAYNPPPQFKIQAEHFTVYEDLQKVLEKL